MCDSGPARSIPTTPRALYFTAFFTRISFSSSENSRARQKMSPARTPYSRQARSIPRSAAWMMWSRSRSPPEVALHRVEAQLDQRHAARAELLADDLVDRALDRRRRRLNLLGPVVQDRQVLVQRRDRLRLGGHQVAKLPVGGDRQLEALLVRDRPEDVRRDRATHVDVQIAELEAGIEHLSALVFAKAG